MSPEMIPEAPENAECRMHTHQCSDGAAAANASNVTHRVHALCAPRWGCSGQTQGAARHGMSRHDPACQETEKMACLVIECTSDWTSAMLSAPGASSVKTAQEPRRKKTPVAPLRPARLGECHCNVMVAVLTTDVVHSCAVLRVRLSDAFIPMQVFRRRDHGIAPNHSHHEVVHSDGVWPLKIMDSALAISNAEVTNAWTAACQSWKWTPNDGKGIPASMDIHCSASVSCHRFIQSCATH